MTAEHTIDIYGILPTVLGDIGVVVTCKNYDEPWKVGTDILKETEMLAKTLKARQVVVITTSYFSNNAIDYANRRSIKIIDKNGLIPLARKFSSQNSELTETESSENSAEMGSNLTYNSIPSAKPSSSKRSPKNFFTQSNKKFAKKKSPGFFSKFRRIFDEDNIENDFKADEDKSSNDGIHFSVFSPRGVPINEWFTIELWAYIKSKHDEIVKQAMINLGQSDVKTKSKGPFEIHPGTKLTSRLEIEEQIDEIKTVKIDDEEDMIRWNGVSGNADFRLKIQPKIIQSNKDNPLEYIKIPAKITIYANGIRVTRLYFEIITRPDDNTKHKYNETSQVTPIQLNREFIGKAFVSYSSKDLNEVLGRIQIIQKFSPKMEIIMDKHSLHSGELWKPKLKEFIEEADVFYLFWSSNACKSEWVNKEWRCAYNLKGLGFIDPIPLESPDKVPPPNELSDMHFNDWVLAYKRIINV